MSVQVENLEKNTAKLTIEVPAEKFEEAVQHSYNKNKGKFNIPGFRKGSSVQHDQEDVWCWRILRGCG